MSKTLLLLTLAVMAPLYVAQGQPDASAVLDGTWSVVAAEQRGRPFDAIRGGKLTIAGGTFELMTAVGNKFSGTVRVDAQASPKELDFLHDENDLVWHAIYQVDEGVFRLNYVDAATGDPRPELFATSADSGGTLIVLSREGS